MIAHGAELVENTVSTLSMSQFFVNESQPQQPRTSSSDSLYSEPSLPQNNPVVQINTDAMANSFFNTVNPFARREEYSTNTINVYKVTTLVSYLVLVVTTFYYTFNKPHEGHHPHKKIWGNNRSTPFAQDSIITSVYW